jgi:hypothetical protein
MNCYWARVNGGPMPCGSTMCKYRWAKIGKEHPVADMADSLNSIPTNNDE